jgi:hypothetical protein
MGGNSAIVTRYRLDSQFHCSYLESRKVPEKNAGNTGKNAGNDLSFISGSGYVISCHLRWRHFWWSNFRWLPVMQLPVTSLFHTVPPQIIHGWCFYTTDVCLLLLPLMKCILKIIKCVVQFKVEFCLVCAEDKYLFNTLVSNHVKSEHVPSFSCFDVWNVRQTTSAVYAITVATWAYHSRRCGRL